MTRWRIVLTAPAQAQLAALRDRRVREVIARSIDRLGTDPERQGKPLLGELADYRSLRAVGQRYRLIYRVEMNEVVVYVVALGIRKEGDKADVYILARRLLQQGVLDPEVGQGEDGATGA